MNASSLLRSLSWAPKGLRRPYNKDLRRVLKTILPWDCINPNMMVCHVTGNARNRRDGFPVVAFTTSQYVINISLRFPFRSPMISATPIGCSTEILQGSLSWCSAKFSAI